MVATTASPGLPRSTRFWVLLCVALLLALGFIAITGFVFEGDGRVSPAADAFDRAIEQLLQQSRAPALTGRVIEVSALGSAPVLIVLALLAYSILVRARDWPAVAHLTVVVAGGGVLSRVLQHLFERERPETLLSFIVVTKGSFPSAHLFGATACYVTFAFLYARYCASRAVDVGCCIAAAILILAIGATRVYLGAHHATDVVAGILGGCAWAFLVAALFTPWYARRGEAER